MKDYYEILGVPPNADIQMIKKAYKKMSSISHPDMVPPEYRQWAKERQKELNEAYEVLTRKHLNNNVSQEQATVREKPANNPQVVQQQGLPLIVWAGIGIAALVFLGPVIGTIISAVFAIFLGLGALYVVIKVLEMFFGK